MQLIIAQPTFNELSLTGLIQTQDDQTCFNELMGAENFKKILDVGKTCLLSLSMLCELSLNPFVIFHAQDEELDLAVHRMVWLQVAGPL